MGIFGSGAARPWARSGGVGEQGGRARARAHLAGVAEAAVEVVLVHPVMEVADPDGLVLLLPAVDRKSVV